MKSCRFLVLCLLGMLFTFPIYAEDKISTVDENALTIYGRFSSAINGRTYQKDMLITYKGYQYIAYYNGNRRVCISRRLLPVGEWNTIEFKDYHFESNDAHNVVSMGICPNDGTIHLAFDHHVHPLHYKVSKVGLANYPDSLSWSAESFSPITDQLEEGMPIKITYPKFWATPDGNLQFNYRVRGSGNGDRMLVDYDAKTGKWKNTRQIDSSLGTFEDELGPSESRCTYPNGYDYDENGVLHTTFVWRENSQGANHDLNYAYSEDKGFTWKNNAGELIDGLPNVNTPGLVVWPIPRVYGLMNDHGQVIDSNGNIHVVVYHATKETIEKAGSYLGELRWGPQAAKRYHHYWRDNQGKWHHTMMNFKVGNRPKVLVDKNNNLYMIYVGTPNVAPDAEEEREDLIVAYASASSQWKDWQVKKVVEGPFMNDALADVNRWRKDGILSVVLQQSPTKKHQSTPLQVIDIKF